MKRHLFRFLVILIGFMFSLQTVSVCLADENVQSNYSLSIMLSTQSTGDQPKIKGYYIYVKDGKDIREEIERVGGWGWSFLGEYIKEVNLKMVGGDGKYKIAIRENRVTVFESEHMSLYDRVVYKK